MKDMFLDSPPLNLQRQSALRNLFIVFLIAIIYALSAQLGLTLATINKSASPVWPASGVGVLMMLLFGPRAALGIILGAFIANFHNTPIFALALLISVGNSLEAIAGFYLFHFLKEKSKIYAHFSKIISLITISIFPTIVSALIGSLSLYLFQRIDENFLSVFTTWWIGDSMGILMLVPTFCIFVDSEANKNRLPDLSNIVVKIWLFSLMVFTVSIIFYKNIGSSYVFILYPLLLISVWTSGLRFTYLVTLAISVLGLYLTLNNLGPFSHGSINNNLLRYQFFTASLMITTLVLEYLYKIREYKWSSVALIGSWFLTGFTYYSIHDSLLTEKNQKFLVLTEKAQLEIQKSLDQYFRLLESGSGLMSASKSVSIEEWKTFISVMNIKDKYPGLNGLGIIFSVENKNLKSFQQKYNIEKIKNVPHGDAESLDRTKQPYYIITYIEPLYKNKQAIGLDVSTEVNRREAALNATTPGSRTMTKSIQLVQDAKVRPGFLIYSPFFKNKKLMGYAYSPIIFDDFITAALKDSLSEINLKVYNADSSNISTKSSERELMYS
ncbi:MAG: CHASE domain-containing protein, partial [Bdellovibrionales bacterium]|nr:CHASE domain-containing protein [Bdellovibrionales bacterium]